MKAKSVKQITETSKDVEIEVMEVHNLFWESYARRDIDLRFSLCAEDITFIGSGLHERALNKAEYKNINREGVKQFPNPFQIEFLWTNLTMLNENVACVESEVVWSQLINNEMSKELLRNTTLLKREYNKWLVTHVHGSVPDYRLKDGDYITNEQTIIRNKELERQVFERTQDLNKTLEELEQKNRELEIETALEKVRSSALAMKEPEEMVNVCNVISNQLELLGIKDIRNVQTAIINEQKVTYLNYQYFAAYKEGVIEETDFNKHPTVLAMVEEMKKSANSSFSGSMKGKELITFREWRKQNSQFPDPILDEVDSAYYYFYSIGLGGLGLTTYKPLPEEGLDIFKRFHNVFTLAYRRFIDIEKAIARAREAKIEAALEKVRGLAMAMRSSEDLGATVNVFFKELKNLGFLPRRCGVAIINEARRSAYNMITTAGNIGDSFEITGDVNLDSHFVLTNMLLNWKAQQDYFLELDTKQIEEYYRILQPQVAVTNFNDARQYGYYLHFEEGMFYVWIDKELQVNDLQIFRRFTQVIGLAYRRHLDLQKAETQAREAQIEAALERVRSKAMAMQNSEDLGLAVATIFEELDKLNLGTLRCGIGIINKEKKSADVWSTTKSDGGTVVQVSGDEPIIHPLLEGAFDAWLRQGDFSYLLQGKDLNEYYKGLTTTNFKLPDSQSLTTEKEGLKQFYYVTAFPAGNLYAFRETEFPEEAKTVMKRFADVINFTYTRFNDLKQAEAQTREANIELALERVRARTMAMQRSEELSETSLVLFQQFTELGIIPNRFFMGIVNEEEGVFDLWITEWGGSIYSKTFKGNLEEPLMLKKVYDAWRAKDKAIVVDINGENFVKWNEYLKSIDFPIASRKSVSRVVNSCAIFSKGFIAITTLEIPNTETVQLLTRFASVFDGTYTRFFDLQKAEAQAREAQVEASLERVRSKALAMHSPNDLSETVSVFFKELRSLNVLPWRCGVGQINEETKTTFLTTTSNTINGESFEVRGTLQQEGHPVLDGIFEHWKLQKEYYPVLQGDDIRKYYEIIKPQIAYPKYPLDAVQYGHFIFIKEGFVFAWTENKLSEGELGIFRRFASVLSLTYRRYLDLKEAEAQNKIIQAENERKTKELEEARQLQLAMLPKSIPEIPNLDIAVYMKTATEVGGDYYDFKVQENGVLNIGIGDATGHGLQAGTMITLMKGFFTSDVAKFNPKKFLEHCNGMIRDIKLGRILMSFSHLRFENNSLLISSAGMPPIYYYHKKNYRTEEIIIQGLPLGAMGSASYKLVEKQLNSGDTILLLTDGLPEQMNSHKVIFDYSRVLKYFGEIAENTPNEIINRLVQKADEWTDGQKQSDDITFVVVRVL